METLLVNAGIGVIALFILWQFSRDRTAENLRKDEAFKVERELNRQNHQEFILMLAGLMGKQNETLAATKETEAQIGIKVTGARDDILEAILMFKEFSAIVLGLLLEDPPATKERIRRAMQAFGQGDMKKAQAVADELPLPAPVVAPTPLAEVRQ